jgi:hypothetical protein
VAMPPVGAGLVRYLAAGWLVALGFLVGAWYGSTEHSCRAVEVTPLVTLVDCP